MSANKNEPSKDNTGTPDITYDLVSAIYHALQGAETEARYIADAEATGDQETIQFFRQLKQDNARRADDAKRLLAKHLGQQQGGAQSQGKTAGGAGA
jgi:hypothetical protein